MELSSPVSPALQTDFLPAEPSGKPGCQPVVSKTERGQDTGFECADRAGRGVPGQNDAWLTRCTVSWCLSVGCLCSWLLSIETDARGTENFLFKFRKRPGFCSPSWLSPSPQSPHVCSGHNLSHRATSQILSCLCLYQQPWDEVKGSRIFLFTVAEYT